MRGSFGMRGGRRRAERPEKGIDELAEEQGVRGGADYVKLLEGLWETEEEREAFRREYEGG